MSNEKPFGIIYKATNLLTGKCYIGQTTRTLEKRINEHVSNSNSYKSNMVFHKAIKKYGIENFKWEVLCKCDNKLLLDIRETMKIIVEHSHINENKGYNITFGGEGCIGYKHTDETKQKISKSNKGKIFTDEHKKKIGKINKDKLFSNEWKQKLSESKKGKHHTDETKQKISNSNKGKILTEETKRKIGESKIGKHLTDEHKNNISNTIKNDITNETRYKLSLSSRNISEETREKQSNSRKGKHFSEDHKRKISEARKCKKLIIYNDFVKSNIEKMLIEKMTYTTIAKEIGVSPSTIGKWIRKFNIYPKIEPQLLKSSS